MAKVTKTNKKPRPIQDLQKVMHHHQGWYEVNGKSISNGSKNDPWLRSNSNTFTFITPSNQPIAIEKNFHKYSNSDTFSENQKFQRQQNNKSRNSLLRTEKEGIYSVNLTGKLQKIEKRWEQIRELMVQSIGTIKRHLRNKYRIILVYNDKCLSGFHQQKN